jgi:hypothetical protein
MPTITTVFRTMINTRGGGALPVAMSRNHGPKHAATR